MISINDLSDDQKNAIRQWAADGANLDEIHTKIRDEFDLRLTFMDARFLVADLEIEFEEEEEEEVPVADETPTETSAEAPLGSAVEEGAAPLADEQANHVPAEAVEDLMPEGSEVPDVPNVSVSISDIAAPGAMASGTVDFGNGQTAIWTIDQMGRLGLNPTNGEYEPTEMEIMAFQTELQRLVQSRGY